MNQAASEQNERLVNRMVDAINRRDLAALDDIVAPDLQRHSGATSGITIKSRDQFKAFLEWDNLNALQQLGHFLPPGHRK